jgi:hypothetical protein
MICSSLNQIGMVTEGHLLKVNISKRMAEGFVRNFVLFLKKQRNSRLSATHSIKNLKDWILSGYN